MFAIRVTTPGTFSEAFRARLEEFVAQWNRTKFWPKAYLADIDGGIWVVGECAYLLADEVHAELLATFIDRTMSCAGEMFKQLSAAVEVPSTDELESWLRETG